MAAYELKIKAMSLTDLEGAVAEVNRRFHPEPIPASPPAARAPRRGRAAEPDRAVYGEPLLATPPAEPAGEEQAADEAADRPATEGGLGSDRGGPGDPVEARIEHDLDAPAAGLGGGDEGDAAAGEEQTGAAALPEEGADADVSDEVAEGGRPEAATLATVQALAKALGAKGGVAPVQAVFKAHGVISPVDIDPEKIIALVAAFEAELAK